jgi:hypothetical protein
MGDVVQNASTEGWNDEAALAGKAPAGRQRGSGPQWPAEQ